MTTLRVSKRPTFRGVLHQIAFFVSLVAGVALLAVAPTPRALVGVAVYVASLSALLGTSALYHRLTWSVPVRRWMGRLDHSMINVLIAGTFTPFGLVIVSGDLAGILLWAMWAGALLGIGEAARSWCVHRGCSTMQHSGPARPWPSPTPPPRAEP